MKWYDNYVAFTFVSKIESIDGVAITKCMPCNFIESMLFDTFNDTLSYVAI